MLPSIQFLNLAAYCFVMAMFASMQQPMIAALCGMMHMVWGGESDCFQ